MRGLFLIVNLAIVFCFLNFSAQPITAKTNITTAANQDFWTVVLPASEDAKVTAQAPANGMDDEKYFNQRYDIYERGGAIMAGKFNADPWEDIAFVTDSGRLRIWLQNPECHELQEWLDISVGFIPDYLESGDVNDDGLTDLVTIGWARNDYSRSTALVQIYYQSPGGFTPHSTIYEFPNTYENRSGKIRIGDINGDQRSDIILAATSDGMDFLYQQPDGSFTVGKIDQVPTDPLVIDLAVKDLNSDGLLDVVLLNHAREENALIYYQNTSGELVQAASIYWPKQYPEGFYGRLLQVGDVTGDQLPDIILVGRDQFLVFENVPGAEFRFFQRETTYNNPVSPQMVDMNNDGKLDLVFINSGWGTVETHYQLPQGGLDQETHEGGIIDAQIRPYQVISAISDVTGDGRLDIAYFALNYGLMVATKGLAGICYVQPKPHSPVPVFLYASLRLDNSYELIAEDVNGDGLEDFVALFKLRNISADCDAQVILQMPDGSFSFGQDLFMSNSGLGGLSVGDINGDSRPEIVATDEGWTNIYISYQNTSGVFLPPITISTVPKPSRTFIDDWTGDGRNDVMVISSSMVALLPQQPDGTLASPIFYPEPAVKTGYTSWVDWNGDSWPDLVLWDYQTEPTNQPVHVYLWNPGIGFIQPDTASDFDMPTQIQTGDINNDGRPDVVLSKSDNPPTSKLGLIYQQADGSMTDRKILSSPFLGTLDGIVISDLNLDGLNDLLVIRDGNFASPVFTQDEQHNFEYPYIYNFGADRLGQNAIAQIDTDKDGDTDIIGYTGNNNAVELLKVYGVFDPSDVSLIFLPVTIK